MSQDSYCPTSKGGSPLRIHPQTTTWLVILTTVGLRNGWSKVTCSRSGSLQDPSCGFMANVGVPIGLPPFPAADDHRARSYSRFGQEYPLASVTVILLPQLADVDD